MVTPFPAVDVGGVKVLEVGVGVGDPVGSPKASTQYDWNEL